MENEMAEAYAKAHFRFHEDPATSAARGLELPADKHGAENERSKRRLWKLPKDGGELPNETRYETRAKLTPRSRASAGA